MTKVTKRSLLTSALALVVCVSMLIGTTYAWFTDSVVSNNNIITSGNLDVELDYYNGTAWTPVTESTELFDDATLWEPGHTEVVYLRVKNAGSLALNYNLGVNIISETEGTNAAGKNFKLSDYILFGTKETDAEAFYANRDDARADVRGKIISTGYTKTASQNSGDVDYVTLVVYMPETVGNVANYKTGTNAPEINLGINLVATQYTYEKDSFGNDYDEDALVCDVIANPSNFQEILANAAEGTVIGLSKGEYVGKITIPQNNITLVSNSAIVDSVDLNGKNGVTIDGLTFYAIYDLLEVSSYKQSAASCVPYGYYASITNTTSTAYGADDVTIKNCTFVTRDYTVGWGNYDPATYVAIDFQDQGRVSGASTNITIENCTFTTDDDDTANNAVADAVNWIRLEYVEGNVVIKNNKFLGATSHHNIQMGGNGADLTIVGNSFNNWADGEYAFGTSRDGTPGIIDLTISDNTFNKAMTAGEEIPVLSIKSSYTAANSSLFVENNVANNGYATIDAERRADSKYYMTATATSVANKADINNALSSTENEIVVNANGANIGDLNEFLSTVKVPTGKKVTIANAKVEGTSYGNKVNGTVVFENCTFTNSGAYSIHFDGGNGKVIFNNCTLVGWCTFGSVEVEMNNCTIKGNGTYALVRSYKDATLTNCVFDITDANYSDGYAEGVDCGENPTNTITLIGCTNVNGAIADICDASQVASGNIVIQ